MTKTVTIPAPPAGKKGHGKTIPFAPPSMPEKQIEPSPLDRKDSGGKKVEQINFQVSSEVKREIKLMCAELGISQQDYLERIHNHYKASFKG